MHCLRLLLPCIAIVAGCAASPDLPKVHPTTGTVSFTNGRPFAGGLITLTSTTDPRLVMDAPINDDGTFRLATVAANQRLDGAIEGTYRVMVSSRFTPGSAVTVYNVAATVTIEAKENLLAIEVDAAAGRKQ